MQTSGGGRDDSLLATAVPDGRARLQHQPALDGLRGLAVAAVLLFHGGHLRGGFLGVDAFFVLSGFLITSLLLVEAGDRGRISLRAFWGRRARRLLPALVCMLGAVALYAWLLAKPDELATIRGDAFATIGYFANWRAIFTSRDYWSLFRSPSPLDHTWSLAIEEQFYLAWPLLVAVLIVGARGRRAARRVLVASVALAAGSLAWSLVIFEPTNPSRVYFGTDTRVASILVGAALAAWLRWRGPVHSRGARATLEVAAFGALVVLALAWSRLTGSSTTLYRGGLFVCALCTALLIAAAVHPRPGGVRRLLSFRPLGFLGLISYGVYLWHWPIYVVLDASRVHLGGRPLLAVRIGVTLVVAVVSYRFVEQPIRHGTRVRRPAVRVSVAFATAVALIVALVASTAGAPAVHVVVADQIRPPEPIGAVPARRSGPGVYKVGIVQDNVPRRVLVVGNSMALYAADEGFKRIQTSPPLDVLNLGSIGCRLLPEETRTRYPHGGHFDGQARVCRDNWALAVSRFRPNVVVMLVSEPTDAEHEIDGHWTAPCRPDYDTVFERELRDQLRLLSSGGAHVVLTTTAYVGLPYKTPQWYAHNDCQNSMLRQIAASDPKVVMADLFKWMCPRLDADCDSHVDDVVLRPDGVHFRDTSARLLAAWIIAQGRRRGIFKGVRVDALDARLAATPPSP